MNSCLYDKMFAPMHMTLGDILLPMCTVCCWGGKMSADGKPAHCRTRILTGSARKSSRKEVLSNYNKTRINIKAPKMAVR